MTSNSINRSTDVSNIDFDNPGKAVARPHTLAHVVLWANDFPKMRQWYLDFFNASVSYENEMLCFLTYDHEHHRIALGNRMQPGKLAPKDNTFAHAAFTFANLPELFLAYRQRLQYGIKPHWCVNHGPTISMYYKDPDGNHIETQVDVYDTSEDATAFMMSEEFAENPIGVDFDPEVLLQRMREGEGFESLTRRERIGKRGPDSIPA
ncbi:Glyoxalase/Bleomycin resistance protein/Dihydroxybiphenyl dioxygenase [Pseudovirgaria hyperparasitica]|uniref:Glyoxalase/Bleomycin resistance protein/Dihydroxybiphenyl dioxygenase n=1 Tax=Pseudovirgaria hyperparasitica TaxID=470096 RepID=A0A6A6WLY3_9PEZI|nr:Glyoxalase/Bleomycin resistance protein/Dihydroxybiphenyl dioxygenase [Pseudovirgaria hyperparasitica]KAF2763217.1 Glyoxalase/Bleomycin resistance protein/Dihydroxybiphenyl dioxygenase [Pseudovirgaria hyperparasitica]